jgi:GDPmannose 4,6-dehydratase
MAKTALITGVTGQDASYLVPLLLDKGYIVHGIRRRSSLIKTDRIDHLYQDPHHPGVRFFLHYGDMTDANSVLRIIQQTQPDEIYNLAAQSHVAVSFEAPEYTANADALGPLRILEAVRVLGLADKTRVFQASTSELYGNSPTRPQNEDTPFCPCSPYAVAKLYAFWIAKNYREAYGMFACNGIFFNHESPARGETFVTRKITRGLAGIVLGQADCLFLGNLDAARDWGHAADYVRAMHLILQQDAPDDYVVATGVTTTVREFARLAFAEVGVALDFAGSGVEEQGVIGSIDGELFRERVGRDPGRLRPGTVVIKTDPCYFRPVDVECLLGDSSKAREQLGWEPTYSLKDLVAEMVAADLQRLG